MIKEIQGLRAIAIIMVLVVHGLAIVPPSWQDYVIKLQRLFFTSTGVEIFFVLAGYFLIYSLERFLKASAEKEIGKVETLLMFLVKKFKRLAPNVYFWASIIFIFGLLSKNQYPWQDSIIETKKFLSTIKISSSSLYTELVNGSNASSKYLETLYAAIDTVKIFWFITPSL